MSEPGSSAAERGPLPVAVLRQRYGRGYFHGTNSGFSARGYDAVHATWRHWMPFVRHEVGAGALWLDLGSAYGFLIDEALDAGFRAFGLDASEFALTQARDHAPSTVGRGVAGHAERLPFRDQSFAVVSAFDLLEHVPDPEQLIAEAARVLRPGGLFIAATPDPMIFDRDEPTHVAEHTPSWWVRTLERHGFAVALRFFQAPFNCELVGRRGGGSIPAITFDALGAADPTLDVASELLRVAYRAGVGTLEADGVRILDHGATIYLLNVADRPVAIDLEMAVAGVDAWSIKLGGRVVGRFPGDEVGGRGGPALRTRFLLPSGGHTLRIETPAGWLRLRRLRVDAAPTESEELCLTLPFDLYERYTLVASVVRELAPEGAILDVGGTIGADQSHLGWTGDFLPERQVLVVDARVADHAHHRVIAPGVALPFADGSFAVVSAQDVLEHVSPRMRDDFLSELWRVSARFVLLGNPFATPGAREADRYLFELIRSRYGYEHSFLGEHLGHGLPELDAALAFFVARGASVAVLPNGHLPTWLLLQTLNAELSHPEQDLRYVFANRSVNAAQRAARTCEPAYRHLLVIDRQAIDHRAALGRLCASGPTEADVAATLAAEASARTPGEGRS